MLVLTCLLYTSRFVYINCKAATLGIKGRQRSSLPDFKFVIRHVQRVSGVIHDWLQAALSNAVGFKLCERAWLACAKIYWQRCEDTDHWQIGAARASREPVCVLM